MTAALRFGANSKAYRNSGTYLSPSWQEIKNVNDTLDCDAQWDKTDAQRRGATVKMQEPTLLGVTLTFKMLENLNDAQYLALRTANFTKTAVDMLVCSGDRTVSGETYVRCEYKVSGWKKGEPNNGINTIDVTMEPCYSDNDIQVGVTPLS